MKEQFLIDEWNKFEDSKDNYENFEDYKNFMNESVEQYIELKKIVNEYNVHKYKYYIDRLDYFTDDFDEIKEYGYNNYKSDEYVDFNYKNLTCTVEIDKNDNLLLLPYVEIWNDGVCACYYNLFNIEKVMVKND